MSEATSFKKETQPSVTTPRSKGALSDLFLVILYKLLIYLGEGSDSRKGFAALGRTARPTPHVLAPHLLIIITPCATGSPTTSSSSRMRCGRRTGSCRS